MRVTLVNHCDTKQAIREPTEASRLCRANEQLFTTLTGKGFGARRVLADDSATHWTARAPEIIAKYIWPASRSNDLALSVDQEGANR